MLQALRKPSVIYKKKEGGAAISHSLYTVYGGKKERGMRTKLSVAVIVNEVREKNRTIGLFKPVERKKKKKEREKAVASKAGLLPFSQIEIKG